MLSRHSVEQSQGQVFPSVRTSGISRSKQQQDTGIYPKYKELVPLVLVVLKLCFNGKAVNKRPLICEKMIDFYNIKNLDTSNWDKNKVLSLMEQVRDFSVRKKYMFNTTTTRTGHGGYGVWELTWHGMRKATNWMKANPEHPWLKLLIQPTVALDELQQEEILTDESPVEPELDQKFDRMFRENEILEWIILSVWKKGGKGIKKLLVNELADAANLSDKMRSFKYVGPGGSALATSTIFGNALQLLRDKWRLIDMPGGGVYKLTKRGEIAGALLEERGLSPQLWMRPPGRTNNRERWMRLMEEVELRYSQNFHEISQSMEDPGTALDVPSGHDQAYEPIDDHVSVTEEVTDQTQEELPTSSEVLSVLLLDLQKRILTDSLIPWKRYINPQVIDQMIDCLNGNVDHTKDMRIIELESQVASLEDQNASKDRIIDRWESIGDQVDTIRGEGNYE